MSKDREPIYHGTDLDWKESRAERTGLGLIPETLASRTKTLARDLFGLGVIGLGILAGYAVLGPESFQSLQKTAQSLLQRIPPLP